MTKKRQRCALCRKAVTLDNDGFCPTCAPHYHRALSEACAWFSVVGSEGGEKLAKRVRHVMASAGIDRAIHTKATSIAMKLFYDAGDRAYLNLDKRAKRPRR